MSPRFPPHSTGQGNFTLGNAYFAFVDGGAYNKIHWFDEYEKGYVYVNPTATDVATVVLPQAVRQLTRATLGSLIDALPIVTAIPLKSHQAAFLLKTP